MRGQSNTLNYRVFCQNSFQTTSKQGERKKKHHISWAYGEGRGEAVDICCCIEGIRRSASCQTNTTRICTVVLYCLTPNENDKSEYLSQVCFILIHFKMRTGAVESPYQHFLSISSYILRPSIKCLLMPHKKDLSSQWHLKLLNQRI